MVRSGHGRPEGGAGPTAGPGAAGRARFSTRRRLIASFAAVLLASLWAPLYQLVSLHRMDATLDALEEQERRMFIALELEDALLDEYEQAAQFVAGNAETAAGYERARARALELLEALTARMPAAEAQALEARMRDATSELGQMVRVRGVALPEGSAAAIPALHDRVAATGLADDHRGWSVVMVIEESIHAHFRELQRSTSAFRRQLVELGEAAQRWTALLLIVPPLLVTATVLYLSRSVARPLARLSEGAAALASGDLDTHIDLQTPDEFGALAAKFNAMTVALKQHRVRHAEAEKMAGIGRVAAGMAHELNNPLQVILGYLSLNRDVPDPRLAEQLAATEEEALRCKSIVDGMLELSRPPAQAATRVDLRELCEDVAGRLRATAQQGAIRLAVRGSALAVADRARLRQVVFNLVKNALEAAGPAGEVDVVIGASERSVEIAVSDSGPGLAPEARARIFEPFFTTKPEGTGLGLAVSRSIARAHGGDIDIGAGGAGGAVFTLRLPRAAEARG